MLDRNSGAHAQSFCQKQTVFGASEEEETAPVVDYSFNKGSSHAAAQPPCLRQPAERRTTLHFGQRATQSNASNRAWCASGADVDQMRRRLLHA